MFLDVLLTEIYLESEKYHTIHLSLKEFMKTTNTEFFVVGEKLNCPLSVYISVPYDLHFYIFY